MSRIPYPGLRNIKTGIAVAACILFYHILDREGALMATTATLICMQDSVEKSVRQGFFRVIGTVIGGIFGIAVAYLDLLYKFQYGDVVAGFLGVILLIYLCNVFKIQDAIIIACFVFLIIIISPHLEVPPIIYATNRVVDTIVGIIIAILINVLLFKPKHIEYEIVKESDQRISKWSGGMTRELYIYPKTALYTERNFDWRISSATIELDESSFTKLSGYFRHIMVLSGNTKLIHEGHHTIDLAQYGQDEFSGTWDTKSQGKCLDFNLMLKEGLKGEISKVENTKVIQLTPDTIYGFYCLQDGVTVAVNRDGQKSLSKALDKNDFIIFNEFKDIDHKPYECKIYQKGNEGEFRSLESQMIAVQVKIEK